MSVYFYCDVWVFAKDPKDLDGITNQELEEMAIRPRNSPDEGQAWLTEARRERAGKIEGKHRYKMQIYAGGSRGHCLDADELSRRYPNLLFIERSGADCTEEELIALLKNGQLVLSCRDKIPYEQTEFFKVLSHPDYDAETISEIAEKLFYDLYQKMTTEDFEDAIIQQDPEEQHGNS